MLKEARKKKKYSLKQLSNAINNFVTSNGLRKIEKGNDVVDRAIKKLLDPILDSDLTPGTITNETTEVIERELNRFLPGECIVEFSETLLMATWFNPDPIRIYLRRNQLNEGYQAAKNEAKALKNEFQRRKKYEGISR